MMLMQVECYSTQITSASPASMKDVQQNYRKVIWTELDHVKEAAKLDLVMGTEDHVKEAIVLDLMRRLLGRNYLFAVSDITKVPSILNIFPN